MNDPVIDDIRRIRREISKEIGPNLDGLVERYAKLEAQFAKPILMPKDRRTIQRSEAAKSSVSAGENQSSPPGDVS